MTRRLCEAGLAMHAAGGGPARRACAGIVAALVARIYCEILIVLFRMNEALQDIRRK
ncbi:MAG: hypothetical protein KIS72_01990 [Luteimonas sp.]|nr:hypothetical protein [Luteimonas sp.]